MQRALALSVADHDWPAQETGVTGTRVTEFGPATRTQYEAGQWDLVPASNTASIPASAERKREPGAPGFLTCTGNGKLGALLTIYHEIPLSRELFLDRLERPATYGFDAEWWQGKAIDSPVYGDDDSETASDAKKFTHELQRLMAFLDASDRAYASADALAQNRLVAREQASTVRGKDQEATFLSIWRTIYESREAMVEKLFSVGCTDDRYDAEAFAMLDLNFPNKFSEHRTLYDVADDLLWPRGTGDSSSSAYLSRVGDIIVFRLEGDENSKALEISPTWYPDRYTKENGQAAQEMRKQKGQIEQKLRQVYESQAKLSRINDYRTPLGQIEVAALLKTAGRHELDETEAREGSQLIVTYDDSDNADQGSQNRNLTNHINKLIGSIDKRLEGDYLQAWYNPC